MIYLDTNVFVYASINNGVSGEKWRRFMEGYSKTENFIFTSSLTWDEVVHSIWKNVGKERALMAGRAFLSLPGLKILRVDELIISKSQEIIEQYNLKSRDAIHAATAIINKIPQIASDDTDFDKVEELERIKVE